MEQNSISIRQLTALSTGQLTNAGDVSASVTSLPAGMTSLMSSPPTGDVSGAYMAAALTLSLITTVTNLLIVASIARSHRLQTASNCLLLAQCVSDGLIGAVLPAVLLLRVPARQPCLLPAALLASLAVTSVLTTVAIAIDRFTSLAQPLRYNNMVTRRHVVRYTTAAWSAGVAAGFAPTLARLWTGRTGCDADQLDRLVAAVLAAALYIPAALIVSACYLYVYCVARTHARAIQTVEKSLGRTSSLKRPAGRCWQLLLLMVAVFVGCWTPLLVAAVTRADWLYAGGEVARWLVLLAMSSAAWNPFLYSLHNAELRHSCARVLLTLLGRLGVRWPGAGSSASMAFSTASHVRLCAAAAGHHTFVLASVPAPPPGAHPARAGHEAIPVTNV